MRSKVFFLQGPVFCNHSFEDMWALGVCLHAMLTGRRRVKCICRSTHCAFRVVGHFLRLLPNCGTLTKAFGDTTRTETRFKCGKCLACIGRWPASTLQSPRQKRPDHRMKEPEKEQKEPESTRRHRRAAPLAMEVDEGVLSASAHDLCAAQYCDMRSISRLCSLPGWSSSCN